MKKKGDEQKTCSSNNFRAIQPMYLMSLLKENLYVVHCSFGFHYVCVILGRICRVTVDVVDLLKMVYVPSASMDFSCEFWAVSFVSLRSIIFLFGCSPISIGFLFFSLYFTLKNILFAAKVILVTVNPCYISSCFCRRPLSIALSLSPSVLYLRQLSTTLSRAFFFLFPSSSAIVFQLSYRFSGASWCKSTFNNNLGELLVLVVVLFAHILFIAAFLFVCYVKITSLFDYLFTARANDSERTRDREAKKSTMFESFVRENSFLYF